LFLPYSGTTLSNYAEPMFRLWDDTEWHRNSNCDISNEYGFSSLNGLCNVTFHGPFGDRVLSAHFTYLPSARRVNPSGTTIGVSTETFVSFTFGSRNFVSSFWIEAGVLNLGGVLLKRTKSEPRAAKSSDNWVLISFRIRTYASADL